MSERAIGAARAALATLAALAALAAAVPAAGQETPAAPTADVVATAHLDTQWRWTVKRTIDEYLPATLRDNFALLEKYPGYQFNFEGAFRYMLMREYYPREYERMRQYVREGRWHVCGSWVDAVDVNLPAPESLIRHALYGNGYFRRELGVTSRDVFLPDCFGFGFALPSIAAHCGLLGFSTQKLTWGSAHGVPFDIGLWEGVDGSTLVAALQPGSYVGRIRGDLSADSTLIAQIARQGAASGLHRTVRYFGTGDTGGAPAESSVYWLERSLAGAGPVTIRTGPADRFAREIAALPAAARARLPRWRGELLMTDHGAGCYTSQAEMKRLNRASERLAAAAEPAAVAAALTGGAPYPRELLRENWIRFLWHQFHDDLTGTSIPEAYAYSWNDEAIAANVFAQVLTESVGALARGVLDTRAAGVPLVVYNPVGVARADVVEAEVPFPDGPPRFVRVISRATGDEVPAQVAGVNDSSATVVFVAAAPPVGFAVYDVQAAAAPGPRGDALRATAGPTGALLENARYRVAIDAAGDIVSVVDKASGRELLSAPARLQLLDDEPREWPAWEIDYDDIMAPPRAVVGGPARLRVVEDGPARVVVEIAREAAGSRFVQRVALAARPAGSGDWVEVRADIDWRTPGTLLKAAFPLAAADTAATYDLGVGTIRRGVNRPRLYEVPAQRWADVTAADGTSGVAVLSDSRHGWDRPDSATLRLSLVHAPRVNAGWTWVADQGSQDLGRHRTSWAIAGHEGDWRAGNVPWLAERFDQPLRAFVVAPRRGAAGPWLSTASVTAAPAAGLAAPVALRALKLAEESDEIVVRLQELAGSPAPGVAVRFLVPVRSAREVNGAEEPLAGAVRVRDGALLCDLGPYQTRAFAVRLARAGARARPPASVPLDLPWNLDGISDDAAPADGDFDGAGTTIAGELLPRELHVRGARLRTGPRGPGEANVVACAGQRVRLPRGRWERLDLLATAVGGDRDATFRVGGRAATVRVCDHAEPVGQWHSRLVAGGLETDPTRIPPGWAKDAEVAWIGTHRHDARGRNEAYAFTHVFRVSLPVPPGARELVLPDDPGVRLLGAGLVRGGNDAHAATPLVERPAASTVRVLAPRRAFTDTIAVALSSPNRGATIRYTLDGREPGPDAPAYAGPLVLRDGATLRARAFAPGLDDAFIATAEFARLTPRPAAAPATEPGLAFAYFAASLDSLGDLAGLAPAREGTLPAVALPSWAPMENFALVLRGRLRAPATGVYTLSLRTDDGSALWLDGELLIDADGLHGEGDDRAEVALEAGWHDLELRYFQKRGDRALGLWWEGPGFGWEPVPAEALGR